MTFGPVGADVGQKARPCGMRLFNDVRVERAGDGAWAVEDYVVTVVD
jgi:hypothetical protein